MAFRQLAARPDFQLFVFDLLSRTGLSEKDVATVAGTSRQPVMRVIEEFAKCFVPKFVDPVDNYELYEFMGDSAVNKATISYLYRKLSKRLADGRSPAALGYLDKIKSACVSTPFLANICTQIGFDEFLDWVIQKNQGMYDAKKEKNYREDVVEAFFGCMEVHIDTLYMYRGYCFVSNILVDILDNIHINYDPRSIWTAPILLKETNDAIRAASNRDPNAKLYEFVVWRPGTVSLIGRRRADQPKSAIERLDWGSSSDTKADAEKELSEIILTRLRADRQYERLVRHPPTAAQLGIQDLL